MASRKGSQRKGKVGEREVVALWRTAGWIDAVRTPNSGGIRPYGARDTSPWPGDIRRVEPFLCEVKYDEKAKAPSRGWVGEAFVRETLLDLQHLWFRQAGVIGGRFDLLPVSFIRASFQWWTAWVPIWLATRYWGMQENEWGWVGLDPADFFELARGTAPPDNPEAWPRRILPQEMARAARRASIAD